MYLIGWGIMLGGSLWWLSSNKYQPGFMAGALVYACALACLRGNTGTDTELYQNMFAGVQLGVIKWQVEDGFALIASLLLAVFATPEVAVRGVSFIFFVLVTWYVVKASHDEQWILLSYILPVFAYQYSMNGLRIGLGSSILLLCTLFLTSLKGLPRALAYLVPISIHYSLFFSAGFIFSVTAARRLFEAIIGGLVLLAAGYLLVIFEADYLFAKEKLYSSYLPPGELSGLSRLVVITVLLIGVMLGKLPFQSKLFILIPTLLFTIFGTVVARDSYAGLRLLDLLGFSMPVATGLVYKECSMRLDLYFRCSTLLAGCLGAIAVGRNFLAEAGMGASPFIPYQLGFHPLF